LNYTILKANTFQATEYEEYEGGINGDQIGFKKEYAATLQ
jgi:hypothetical protein